MTTDDAVRYGVAVPLEVKATGGDSWTLTGVASTWGVDAVGDQVQRGAFRDSLSRRPRVPLLWAHDAARVIGVARRLEETGRGLEGVWKISKTREGQDARTLLLDGCVGALSIGFVARKSRPGAGGVRLLDQVDLHEISIVATPANPAAVITSVKARSGGGRGDLSLRLRLLRGKLRLAGVLDRYGRPIPATEAEAIRLRLAEARRRLERLTPTGRY